MRSSLKLRGGANTNTKVKTFDTDDVVVQNILSMFRSLDVFILFSAHMKCNLLNENTRQNLCQFCLLRSTVLRSRQEKGRLQIKPIEYEAAFGHIDSDSYIEDIQSIIDEIAVIFPAFKEKFAFKWNCTECSPKDMIIDINSKEPIHQFLL